MLGDRFYARVHVFDCACPACGHLIRAKRAGAKGAYQPTISRLQCPSCERIFIVGLVCWPVKVGGHHGHKPTRPADQLPGPRERLALRNQGGGFWPPTPISRTRARTSNVSGPDDAACACPSQGPASPGCALHT